MVEVLTLDIKWHDEDNCYVCKIKEYPGLSAHGDTKEDAIEEAYIALEGFKEVIEEDKKRKNIMVSIISKKEILKLRKQLNEE